ncbi:hypothetical protein L1987_40371 [Smallanthus sonchifolius]|uniref:Uncharacterized protein n=1 Tax=Smallanthus sonchifolius TaxID=185202 RepID=A0ACB9GU60_9ASTR|nr:hypothetical protein L1987_40371 [Smallanthus sonchifolius]
MMRVSPWKGVARFGKYDKLSPRYIGPYKIIACVGPAAYRLQLPRELSEVHNVFHVSNLKKCLTNETLVIPPNEVCVDDKLRFCEKPVDVSDWKIHKTRRSRIKLVKHFLEDSRVVEPSTQENYPSSCISLVFSLI